MVLFIYGLIILSLLGVLIYIIINNSNKVDKYNKSKSNTSEEEIKKDLDNE